MCCSVVEQNRVVATSYSLLAAPALGPSLPHVYVKQSPLGHHFSTATDKEGKENNHVHLIINKSRVNVSVNTSTLHASS